MEQISIRDWFIIVGGAMIALVLVDGARRYYKQRRTEIKLNARLDQATQRSESDGYDLFAELPNGGARVVERDDLNASEVPRGRKISEPESRPKKTSWESSFVQNDPSAEVLGSDNLVTELEEERALRGDTESLENPISDHSDVSFVRLDNPDELEPKDSLGRRRAIKSVSEAAATFEKLMPVESDTVDWLEDLDNDSQGVAESGRLPRGPDTHVFILYVVANGDAGFAGTDILETLLDHNLRFGDMDFFHRQDLSSGRGVIQFSVANMMQPGVFDIDNIEPLQTRGLMFFTTLPGPSDMLKAYDQMYETAKIVAKKLGGNIQDEMRNGVTRQSLEHARQQIRELERRLMIRRA